MTMRSICESLLTGGQKVPPKKQKVTALTFMKIYLATILIWNITLLCIRKLTFT